MSDIDWRRSSSCASGSCVEVAWVRPGRCSTGACVEVAHVHTDQGPRILVRDSKNPKAHPIEWSEDMWQTSVVERVIEGHLPSMATEVGVEAPADMLHLRVWHGGAVKWGPHTFDAQEWQEFVHGIEAAEFTVERLKSG